MTSRLLARGRAFWSALIDPAPAPPLTFTGIGYVVIMIVVVVGIATAVAPLVVPPPLAKHTGSILPAPATYSDPDGAPSISAFPYVAIHEGHAAFFVSKDTRPHYPTTYDVWAPPGHSLEPAGDAVASCFYDHARLDFSGAYPIYLRRGGTGPAAQQITTPTR